MELIIPSVEIWEQNNSLDGIWEHIARCTRVCYQSTPKNDGETDEEFVKRVILRNINDMNTLSCNFEKLHGAMLEHGTVYLYVSCIDKNNKKLNYRYTNNQYSKIKLRRLQEEYLLPNDNLFITTNLRVIYENGWLDDLQYICAPTEHHAKRVTVSFTTNIGVTREFNRHRVNSIAEESTRFCNYTKTRQVSNSNNALGSSTVINDVMPVNGQMRFGLPAWLIGDENIGYVEHHANDDLCSYCTDIADGYDKNWINMDYYMFALTTAEYCYNKLIQGGWKPQQAREVLPLATKSQLIHTAFVDDWKHFFALRADGISGPPHPNAKLVAEPLKQEFIKRGYI